MSQRGLLVIPVAICGIVILVNGISLDTRKLCCALGTNFSTSGLECRSFQPPIAGVEQSDEKNCMSIVDVCCKNRYRELECDKGIEDAKNGISCSTDGERKGCCEACETGIDNGKAQYPCQDELGLGASYDKVFTSCCEDVSKTTSTISSTTTTKATTPATPSSNFKPLYPDRDLFSPSTENICDSDVCAQLCNPVGDSYKCDCFKGYVLMADGISCKPLKRALKKGGRCEINNPCDHDCIDTGTAIKCSCRDGYELAEDNKTCNDIDECVLNIHNCLVGEECSNEIGTFACYETIIEDTEDFDKKCPTGYKFNYEKQVCDDIDECMFELMCIPPKTCKNTVGSFTCEGVDIPQCPPGFHFKTSTQSCTDIDECLTGENNCNKESQDCLNTKGNYTCIDKASKNICPPGFKKNTITQLCEDVDECLENPNLCKENEECINEEGGHTCVPIKTPSSSSTSQVPTTQSTTSTKRPTPSTTTTTTTTTTTPRPVICPKGYKFSPNTNTCDDVNECVNDVETCASSEECINTIGSYVCKCKQGYTKDAVTGACIDVNECQQNTHNCEVAQRCDNTIGSYVCSRISGCGTGYTLNQANGLCEDDNECILGTHNCNQLGSNFKCRNTLGSYRCDPVRTKYKPPPALQPSSTLRSYPPPPRPVPTPRPVLIAPPPSTTLRAYPPRSSVQTTKPNTPSTVLTAPSTQSTTPRTILYYPTPVRGVISNQGHYPVSKPSYSYPIYRPTPTLQPTHHQSYTPRWMYPTPRYPVISGQLKKCLPGYVMNARGECQDINECENNPCARHEKCLNFNGRYECASPMQCKAGYELNDAGDQCVDINECSRGTHKCHSSQICKNGKGYYTCECPPGHHHMRSTQTCEDMDECKLFRPCDTNAECINTKGSFRCECKYGFRKINNVCDDIDECKESPGMCEHDCVNTWGSVRCSCNPGFTLNSDNRTCTDVDECERFKDKKLCIGTCKNVPGSYTCECPPGYKLGNDGRICLDIDECEQRRPCDPSDVCLNTRGGYKCFDIQCPPNYIRSSDQKPRCKRLQLACDSRDYQCLLMPDQYTYQYMTLVSNLPLPEGSIQLFQIKGPQFISGRAEFTMKFVDASAPPEVQKVNEGFFRKIYNYNSMQLYLLKPVQGPQEIKIEIQMQIFDRNNLVGNTVVYIIIVVSDYPF